MWGCRDLTESGLGVKNPESRHEKAVQQTIGRDECGGGAQRLLGLKPDNLRRHLIWPMVYTEMRTPLRRFRGA